MSITVTQGGATVTLTGDLAAWADRAIRSAIGEAGAVIERELQEVADIAMAAWYGPRGVHRQTGKSGHLVVRRQIDLARGTVRYSVGSDDRRQRKGGGEVARLVHRPGPLAKKPGDGKQLMPLFVNGPAKLAIQMARTEIAAAMAKGATDAR